MRANIVIRPKRGALTSIGLILLLFLWGYFRVDRKVILLDDQHTSNDVFSYYSSLSNYATQFRHHEHCFNTSLWFDTTNENGQRVFNIMDGKAKYVPVGTKESTNGISDNTRALQNYNVTCPFMKARYNCDGTPNGREVKKWKFILQENNNNFTCDLGHFIQDFGGPGAIAAAMKRESNDSKESPSPIRKINVLMHGNSLLRQVFEALACKYQSSITDNLLVEYGGPYMTLQGMKERSQKISPEETGELFQYKEAIANNHAKKVSSDNPNYNGKNENSTSASRCIGLDSEINLHFIDTSAIHPSQLSSPPNLKHCNDDIAMMEFNNTIRFYFIFRPFIYQNLTTDLYPRLGFEPHEIDRIFYNDATYSQVLPGDFRRETIASRVNFGLLKSWVEIQKRYIHGKWLGADNVGMDKKPDRHACMPGVPDDEVNLLLFLMLHSVLQEEDVGTNLELLEGDVSNRGPGYCKDVSWC